MYEVDHLKHIHAKGMLRLERDLENSARKMQREESRRERRFQDFKHSLAENAGPSAMQAARKPSLLSRSMSLIFSLNLGIS